MTEVPPTRPSLLLRLSDSGDTAAWGQFIAMYEPALYRYARSKGWQDADARDLVQSVLAALSQRVGDWDPSAERGSFRGWLFRVARHASIDAFRVQQRRRMASIAEVGADSGRSHLSEAGSDFAVPLSADALAAPDSDSELVREYRREVFKQAAAEIKQEFQPKTWQAFVWTHLEGRTIDETAQSLAMSRASVYAARSRIVARLREKVNELSAADEDSL